ncbi:ribonuclease H-like domain-containing protein [Tanacetum coccineum]|uniref:Ribonuclease H-like domain-containing protein n=1 Tax=Tanacetum coccineum TaxID=301880 RepID=A0ABQ5CDI5_9ASTR
MHNNIMAAGLRDRPPMLATGRYAQWRSRFLRYIDTRPKGDDLRKCILEGPYQLTTIIIRVVPATENSPEVPERTIVETILTMSPENKDHYESEKEAIHLLLTRIGDEIYLTVDACKITHEMWEAIERLQQGESLNIQGVKTNLFWEFGKFTSHDGETIESYYIRFYKLMNEMTRNNLTVDKIQINVQFLQQLQPKWSRFVTIVKQQHKLDEVSYDKLFEILKQSQKEVNEHCAERMAKNTNLLALIQQDPQNFYCKLLETKNVVTSPRYTNDNQIGQFGNQRTMTVTEARETISSQVVQQTGIQFFNFKEFDHFAKESIWEKIQEVPTVDSGTDSEPLEKVQCDAEYNVFANKRQHSKQPESIKNTCVVETVDSNVIPDSPNIFAKLERHSISLELALQQCQEQMNDDTVCKEKESNVFLKEREQYFDIQDLKAQLHDKNISIRMYQIDTKTTQTRSPQLPQTSRNSIPRVSTSIGVIHRTSVSRPQLKSTQMKEKVMHNNSQVKFQKTEVDDHYRISKFLNKTLHTYFREEGIEHQTSTPRTPKQNGVVERQNHTLVEAARTMLSASTLPLFFWAKTIATACYTQNRSIIILSHKKTAYHIINDRKPLIRHLYIFGYTCYLTSSVMVETLDRDEKK